MAGTYPATEPNRIIPPYEGLVAAGDDHSLLTNLSWTVSGHIGPADSLAGFGPVGAATTYAITDFSVDGHTHTLADLDVTGIADGEVLTRSGSSWTGTDLSNYALISSLAAVAFSGSASDLSSGTIPDARLSTTGVTPGSYSTADITVDAYGRITAANNGTAVAAPDTDLRRTLELEQMFKTAWTNQYRELTFDGSGDLSDVDIWETAAKLSKLFERTLVYDTGDLKTVTTTNLTSGDVLTTTLTYAGGYGSGGDLDTVTKAIT